MEETKATIENLTRAVDEAIALEHRMAEEGHVLAASRLDDCIEEAKGKISNYRPALHFGLHQVRRAVQKKKPCPDSMFQETYPMLIPNGAYAFRASNKIMQCETFVRQCLQEGHKDVELAQLLQQVLKAKKAVAEQLDGLMRYDYDFSGQRFSESELNYVMDFLADQGFDASYIPERIRQAKAGANVQ